MIVGESVRIRAIEEDDLPRYVEWFNDREVISGLNQYLPMSLRDEQKWFEDQIARDPIERPLAIDVLEEEKWLHIGGCGLFGFDHRSKSAEFGITIGDKRYWDQGYGSEATSLMLEFGFNTLNLQRIGLRVFEDNERARHVYAKLGFIEEGRLRRDRFFNGEYYDTILMSILREEWQAGSNRERANG
jgi:RimJ/RimL family protein N-acetyltransferase